MPYYYAFKWLCIFTCWPSPSNQSFYRQIAGYQRGVGDHRPMMRGGRGPTNYSYKNLTGVHSTMHLMHPNLASFPGHFNVTSRKNTTHDTEEVVNDLCVCQSTANKLYRIKVHLARFSSELRLHSYNSVINISLKFSLYPKLDITFPEIILIIFWIDFMSSDAVPACVSYYNNNYVQNYTLSRKKK